MTAPMSTPTLERVRQIAADVFDVDIAEVTSESSPETIETWDSQAHLNFVVALEAEFGIRFSAVAAADILNVGCAVELVDERLAKRPP
jgi:acyl carrier protein